MTKTQTSETSDPNAWLFDDSPIPDPQGKGERAVKFIKALRHPKSSLPKQAFDLSPWMERLTRRVFGDVRDDGQRKIKTVFLMVGRGNRKTTLAGAWAALTTIGPERRPDSRTYAIANSREQSALTFDELAGICRAHPRTLEATYIQDSLKRVTHSKSKARFAALSNEAKTAHGLTPVFCVVDELHEFTKSDLYDAMQTGLNKSANTLMFIATTAGVGTTTAAYNVYEYAKRVASGVVEDEAFLPVLFEMVKDDDYRDEKVWFKTNPGLSCSPPYPDLDGLRKFVREAEHRPASREVFKRLHLGQWLDGAAEPAWDMSIWDENAAPYDLDALEGKRAWIAVDLSKRVDLTAVGICIEVDDVQFALHVQAFAPSEGIRKRADTDTAPYPLWRDQGYLTECPGDIVDLGTVEDYIISLCDRFDVQEICFDKWSARATMESLEDKGLPVVEFPQNVATYAKPVNDFEDAMFNRRLMHGGNPLLRWAVGNVVLYSDASENRRPLKDKSVDRIDPACVSIMSVGRAMAGNTGRSSYDSASDDDLYLTF
ncbi:terminase TerL endonuclease subunit [Phyllobacterium sp. SB3]|uniref:terminase large subunit n=1 Tax=Phyllobacterium sp. SB3 TaxID=3156073 RepID=UPI0032AE9140